MKKLCLFILLIICGRVLSQPSLLWAKAINGAWGMSIGVDKNNNIYTSGYFQGTVDFDAGPGIYTITATGGSTWDFYLCKTDSAGNFLWVRNKSGQMSNNDLKVDTTGVYVSNYTSILKYDHSGNLVWEKNIAVTGFANVYSLALDSLSNLYITGPFSGTTDLDPGANVYNLTSNGSYDIFLTKLSSSGNFIWAKGIGSNGMDYGTGVVVNKNFIFLTGTFSETVDFNPGPGIFNLTCAGGYDIFVSKMDLSGNFMWAGRFGGTSYEYGNSVQTDSQDNIYLSSSFHDTIDFDPGPGVFNMVSKGNLDVFVIKLNSANNLIWAKQMGGNDVDEVSDMVMDKHNNFYITGAFKGVSDFDPGSNIYNLSSVGNNDVFISQLDSSGNFVCAGAMGGAGNEYGYAVTVDKQSNLVTIGTYNVSGDYDPGPTVYTLPGSATTWNAFVCKVNCSNFVTDVVTNKSSFNFSIYPNPSSGKFTVPFNSLSDKNLRIEITNLLGEKIRFTTSYTNNQMELDLSGNAKGIYFVQLLSENKKTSTKIVLE